MEWISLLFLAILRVSTAKSAFNPMQRRTQDIAIVSSIPNNAWLIGKRWISWKLLNDTYEMKLRHFLITNSLLWVYLVAVLFEIKLKRIFAFRSELQLLDFVANFVALILRWIIMFRDYLIFRKLVIFPQIVHEFTIETLNGELCDFCAVNMCPFDVHFPSYEKRRKTNSISPHST